MKANELMIGSYVKFLGKVRKIKSIVRKDTGAEISFEGKNKVVVSLDEIEPIPLTPEILEKNFQEFLPGINLMYQLKGPYCAMNEDGQWVFGLVKADGENSARYPLVKISFVHELQHCLKLVGIEKEITI